jgi:uncharacterized coiled-coil protein SlyX
VYRSKLESLRTSTTVNEKDLISMGKKKNESDGTIKELDMIICKLSDVVESIKLKMNEVTNKIRDLNEWKM